MLTDLHIQNFAIIDDVQLAFTDGLTVMTGETGAGKSILVDALSLALGGRADAAAVRHGAERAQITAQFDLSAAPAAAQWLAEQAMDGDEECIVRRVVSREGRSRAFINGHSAPVQSLRQLSALLVDIHGQHANQSLLRGAVQRAMLDQTPQVGDAATRTANAYAKWAQLREQLAALHARAGGGPEQLELLRHHVSELDALALGDNEITELGHEHKRLAHQGELLADTQRALALLRGDAAGGDGGLASLAAQAATLVDTSARLDPQLLDVLGLLRETEIQLTEATDGLERYVGTLELDPNRLHWVESRLADIEDLARKHRVKAGELPAFAQDLRQQLADISQLDTRVAQLSAQLNKAGKTYLNSAKKLSKARQKAAAALAKTVTGHIRTLGMPEAVFDIEVSWLVDGLDEAQVTQKYTAHGMDQISFLVSANPGQPAGPLAKVASGGELARIALALELVAAEAHQTPALIFDEVDSGIGGGVAEIVGQSLRTLGQRCQVLCVTHLAQVASQAHQHVQVSKHTHKGQTFTRVEPLAEQARIEELARMMGGIKITERTLEHAREMRERAQS